MTGVKVFYSYLLYKWYLIFRTPVSRKKELQPLSRSLSRLMLMLKSTFLSSTGMLSRLLQSSRKTQSHHQMLKISRLCSINTNRLRLRILKLMELNVSVQIWVSLPWTQLFWSSPSTSMHRLWDSIEKKNLCKGCSCLVVTLQIN